GSTIHQYAFYEPLPGLIRHVPHKALYVTLIGAKIDAPDTARVNTIVKSCRLYKVGTPQATRAMPGLSPTLDLPSSSYWRPGLASVFLTLVAEMAHSRKNWSISAAKLLPSIRALRRLRLPGSSAWTPTSLTPRLCRPGRVRCCVQQRGPALDQAS